MEIKGRDMVSGLPKILDVNSDDVTEALHRDLEKLIEAIKEVMFKTPPELSADVIDKGIVLTGGTSKLRNLDELITQSTGVACYLAEEPELCVVKGLGIALDNLDNYKRSILATR